MRLSNGGLVLPTILAMEWGEFAEWCAEAVDAQETPE